MTLDDFITKYLGKQVEYHSYGAGALYQCVDLVNQYIKEVLELTPIIGTNAKDVPEKASKKEFIWIPNTLEGVPLKGDIVVWNGNVGGGAGHIAIFTEGTTKSFKSFDQNWSALRCKIEGHYYSNVRGWLRPIKLPTTPMFSTSDKLPEYFYKISEFIRGKELYGLEVEDAFDTILDKANTAIAIRDTEIGELKKKLDSKNEALKTAGDTLNQTVKAKDKEILTLSKNLKIADDLIDELEEKIAKNESYEPVEGSGTVDVPPIINLKPTMQKEFFKSKTLWVNVVAFIAMAIQGFTGKEVIGLETQGLILSGINLVLRLVTREEIIWRK